MEFFEAPAFTRHLGAYLDEAADLTPTQKAHLRTAIEMERKTRQARRSARRRR